MGGATSAHQEMETMVACSFLLGQAINRVFPDIYCLSDFHANREEIERKERKKQEEMFASSSFILSDNGKLIPLKQYMAQQSTEAGQNGENIEQVPGEDSTEADETKILHEDCIFLPYKGDQIPLKKKTINTPNDDGWTPLHACCHQHVATDAALELIEYLFNIGEDLNLKTKRGPGSFASDWTPLHIACAYGIEPVALKLIEYGATLNTKNSVGWTPLHESVHRGYENITKALLKEGAESNEMYKPCLMAPHHPQFPLAHACRQGHTKTVKVLLEAGADMNAQNEEGWCALHEAIFYRHKECVQALIIYGCDVTLETKQGHRADTIPTTIEIKTILEPVIPKSKRTGKCESNNIPEEKQENDSNSGAKQKSKDEFRLLGDLPDLSTYKNLTSISYPQAPSDESDQEVPNTKRSTREPHKKKRARPKSKSSIQRTHKQQVAPPQEGIPPEFACQLTGKLMTEPVSSPYGHFEKRALEQWLQTQGNVCPLTGMPLSKSEVHSNKSLLIKLNNWKLCGGNQPAMERESEEYVDKTEKTIPMDPKSNVDDVYDF